MHRSPFLRLTAAALTLAVSLVAVTAIAAPPEKATVSFESLSASGVLGDLTIRELGNGKLMIKGDVTGLEPNTDYDFVFYQNAECNSITGDLGEEVYTFHAGTSGNARINVRLDEWQLDNIGSISIRVATNGTTSLACGAVIPVE